MYRFEPESLHLKKTLSVSSAGKFMNAVLRDANAMCLRSFFKLASPPMESTMPNFWVTCVRLGHRKINERGFVSSGEFSNRQILVFNVCSAWLRLNWLFTPNPCYLFGSIRLSFVLSTRLGIWVEVIMTPSVLPKRMQVSSAIAPRIVNDGWTVSTPRWIMLKKWTSFCHIP